MGTMELREGGVQRVGPLLSWHIVIWRVLHTTWKQHPCTVIILLSGRFW
jgi:hypothetical protein